MARFPTHLPLTCPLCGARVPCSVLDDTGGVRLDTADDEAVVVLTLKITPMRRHMADNHPKEKA